MNIKKITLLALSFVQLGLLSTGFSVHANAQDTPPTTPANSKVAIEPTLPSWINDNSSNESQLQFVGISGVYLSSDGRAKKSSKDAACSQAIGDIAKYFGVQVQVETVTSTNVQGGSVTQNLNERASEKTGLSLFQLKPVATHYEDINNGSHLRAYCLMILNSENKAKIEAELEQSKLIYRQQIEHLQKALLDNDSTKAEIYAATLKGLPLLSQDGRLPPLLEKLTQLQKNRLSIVLTLNKDLYQVGDNINLQTEVNQNAYLYVLMSDNEGWQIIYPNPAQRINRVSANKATEIPNSAMERDGFQLRVLEDAIQENGTLWAIASAKKLLLKRYSNNYGYYDVLEKQGPWLTTIKKCLAKHHCSDSKQVIKTRDALAGVSFRLSGDQSTDKSLQHRFKNELKKLGLTSNSNQATISIVLTSTKRRYFSSMLDIELDEVKLAAKVINLRNSETFNVSVKKSVSVNSNIQTLKQQLLAKLAKKIKVELSR